jgi:ABC-type multidrug transport system ATPase subunit
MFKNVSLTVNPGDIIHIIGQNGSGKSTFYKILMGDLPCSGHIDIDPSEISIVGDYANIPGELLVKDYLDFFQANAHVSNPYFNDLVEVLNLKSYMSRKVSKLSSGETRRLEIACALFRNRKLIIFDEVTNSLDDLSKKEILAFIKSLKDTCPELAVFNTTHDLSEISFLGGRCCFIRRPGLVEHKDLDFDSIIREYHMS